MYSSASALSLTDSGISFKQISQSMTSTACGFSICMANPLTYCWYVCHLLFGIEVTQPHIKVIAKNERVSTFEFLNAENSVSRKTVYGPLFMNFIDRLPLMPLVMITIMLGLAPFVPEPHLLEKIRMLSNGELSKPIDIFDLFMHGTPAVLLVIKLARTGMAKK